MKTLTVFLISAVWAGTTLADGKLKGAAEDAVDANCTVSKAVKGAATKATVGVGNRCGAGETTRDVTGVDGKGKDIKKKDSN